MQEIKETESQEVTEIINEVTETEKSKEGNELDKAIDEHTQVEIGRDNGVELVECIGTRCEHQDSLLQEQREMVNSLEVDCDQVGPVRPNEVEWVSDANGFVQSLGGMETPGFLVVTRISDVIVPECVVECMSVLKCVQNASDIACVSACMELVHGPTQTGDGYSEPNGPRVSISGNAPVSRDVVYGARFAFSE